eukprot:c22545_g1_i1 orf=517-1359(+)
MNPSKSWLTMHSYIRAAAIAAGAPSGNPCREQARQGSPVYTPTPFDTNIVIVTAALLFVLICALGMNAVIKWVFKWTRRLALQNTPQEAALRRRAHSTGIKKTELKLLPTAVYSKENATRNNNSNNNKSINDNKSGRKNPNNINEEEAQFYMQDTQCLICLSDFQDGEKIRVLPKCRHGFHIECVDTWLYTHSSCPTCRGDLTPLPTTRLHHAAPHALPHKRPSTQVQLQVLISPAGTLTHTLCSLLPPQAVHTPLSSPPQAVHTPLSSPPDLQEIVPQA